MKKKDSALTKRLAAAALALALLPALAACGSQNTQTQETAAPAPTQEVEPEMNRDGVPSDTLKGIYDALTAPDSEYSQTKELYMEYYPELKYEETLEADRITLSINANGNEYVSDGSWDFVEEGDYLTAVIDSDDFTGIMRISYVADAIGAYFGMETELIDGYLNGLPALGVESDNFSMTEDETAGTLNFKLNIAGPWDMKELDQMVLDEELMDYAPLDSDFTSQSGSVGKIRMLANGNVDHYTMLFGEFGGLDDLAYQSIVNMVKLREPAGWEAFLADFTALKDVETEAYKVVLDPDDETIANIMGERNGKFSYVLVEFGTDEYDEEDDEVFVPAAEAFADFYFRVIGGYQKGVAGAALAEAQAACDVLAFATGNELWMADTETLRTNLLEAWESLTDEERAAFDENFPDLNELLNACFVDWEANRGRFEDAGVVDTMEQLFEEPAAEWSWEALSANTWTLGNQDG